jgi:HlyD family secretion protein
VAEVDSVGTVSQGVVSYTVKITFDVQDARIKPGMTVNASIQTAVHNDVLIVPSSAVKTINGVSIVQVFDPAISQTGGTVGTVSATLPKQVEVTVGISDDTNVEIISGLTEGQQVVNRTITGTTKPATAATASTRGAGGFGGAGALRIGG